MEIIPISDESSDSPLQEANPAPIETGHLGRQSLRVETLEDRVLLATDVTPPASMPTGVEPPQSPAAYVAQQHSPHEQATRGAAQTGNGETPEAVDDGSTSGGHAEAPGDANGNSKVGGLAGHSGESHAEVVERTSEFKDSELKDSVEPEAHEKGERRFDEKDSAMATIEPEGARSPRDRAAVQRLVGSAAQLTDAAPSDAEPTTLDSPEAASATASAIVSLASQIEPSLANVDLNQVLDQLANKLAQEATTAYLGPSASQAASAAPSEHAATSDAASREDAPAAADDAAEAPDAGVARNAASDDASQPASAVERTANAAWFDQTGDSGAEASRAHDLAFAQRSGDDRTRIS